MSTGCRDAPPTLRPELVPGGTRRWIKPCVGSNLTGSAGVASAGAVAAALAGVSAGGATDVAAAILVGSRAATASAADTAATEVDIGAAASTTVSVDTGAILGAQGRGCRRRACRCGSRGSHVYGGK